MTPIEFPPLAQLKEILRDEVQQRREEGCIVGELPAQIASAGDDRARLMTLYGALTALTPAAL